MTPLASSAAIVAAFNRRRFDDLAAALHDSFQWQDHGMGVTLPRAQFLEDYLPSWLKGLPDLQLQTPRYDDCESTIWVEAMAVGIHGGTLTHGPVTIEASGQVLRLPVAIRHHYAPGGLLRSGEIYYCAGSLLRQLGATALPALGQAVSP